ncbi:conserved hypothetical protein [uncultured Desulfobacterium sp.]|uniref:peptidoglycan glycosyltransferase n=1 Tax=uncultured Desulfobacterium sp. TaxID=201089 RepID=A0A445MXS1_9BACT|nr:conserved hypothetical protein [uncultured Desulfobacterium sp.]
MQRNLTISKGLISVVLLTGCILIAVLVVYCLRLSSQIDTRFSGRLWSIPSKVYSDTTILYPGQGVNLRLFKEKLENLGYHKVSHAVTQKGDLRISASSFEVFLKDGVMYHKEREGFPVRISFAKNTIQSITRMDTKESMPLLELEPEELMLFFGKEREDRRLVALDEVPIHVRNAILASEDARFYDHHGVDPLGMIRAFCKNLLHTEIRQGGSTITQQLAKNYFLSPERTISRKVSELFIALLLEAKYEKDQILEIYLNEIYLGQKGSVSINGIGEAAYFYFNKPVSELSVAEAATIAGLIRAPNIYSPYQDEKRSMERRNIVLQNMAKHHWIPDGQLEALKSEPIKTRGFETYKSKAPYFIDYLSQQLTDLYPREALSSLGLTIYTTLDTQVQTAAEEALEKGLVRLERSHPSLLSHGADKRLQGAIIVMQPKTGYILAMVGGRGYGKSQFNRAAQARRQPGSAFKPIVFLSALDMFSTTTVLSNEPRTFRVEGKSWSPKNYKPVAETSVTMRDALARSINLATVDLAMKVGLDNVVRTASLFHFSTPLMPYPSIALGSSEVIPLELARAYCAFAADGVLPYPLSLKELLDEKKATIERRQITIERVTTPAKAFLITSMLKSVVEYGTARSLRMLGISFPVAGKTGTTNDSKDTWFIGYTPDILALVWVGFDDGSSVASTGASAAVPIWSELMAAIPQYVSGTWFRMPAGVEEVTICSESKKIAVSGACPEYTEEVFLSEFAPREFCDIHNPNPFQKVIKGVRDFLERE